MVSDVNLHPYMWEGGRRSGPGMEVTVTPRPGKARHQIIPYGYMPIVMYIIWLNYQ